MLRDEPAVESLLLIVAFEACSLGTAALLAASSMMVSIVIWLTSWLALAPPLDEGWVVGGRIRCVPRWFSKPELPYVLESVAASVAEADLSASAFFSASMKLRASHLQSGHSPLPFHSHRLMHLEPK